MVLKMVKTGLKNSQKSAKNVLKFLQPMAIDAGQAPAKALQSTSNSLEKAGQKQVQIIKSEPINIKPPKGKFKNLTQLKNYLGAKKYEDQDTTNQTIEKNKLKNQLTKIHSKLQNAHFSKMIAFQKQHSKEKNKQKKTEIQTKAKSCSEKIKTCQTAFKELETTVKKIDWSKNYQSVAKSLVDDVLNSNKKYEWTPYLENFPCELEVPDLINWG